MNQTSESKNKAIYSPGDELVIVSIPSVANSDADI
jgi:hypothetical protein